MDAVSSATFRPPPAPEVPEGQLVRSCSRDPERQASPMGSSSLPGSSRDTSSEGEVSSSPRVRVRATSCGDQVGLHRRGRGRRGQGRDWSRTGVAARLEKGSR